MVSSGDFPTRRAPSSVVEHVTFNHGVPGSIPGGPTSLRSPRSLASFGSAGHGVGVDLLRGNGCLPAVVATQIQNRQRFRAADDACARHPTTRTNDPGWTFGH